MGNLKVTISKETYISMRLLTMQYNPRYKVAISFMLTNSIVTFLILHRTGLLQYGIAFQLQTLVSAHLKQFNSLRNVSVSSQQLWICVQSLPSLDCFQLVFTSAFLYFTIVRQALDRIMQFPCTTIFRNACVHAGQCIKQLRLYGNLRLELMSRGNVFT